MLIEIAAKNLAIIFKRLYTLVIAKELGSNVGNSINRNSTYKNTYSITENSIINMKNILSNHGGSNVKVGNVMVVLSLTANWRHFF